MNQRQFLPIVAMFVALSTPAISQQTANPQRMEQAQERLEKMKERLKLTPEQLEQIKPILADEVQKMKAVRDKYSGDQNRRSRLRMARELKGIRDSGDEKLNKILSKTQMDELKKMREETREEIRGRMAGRQ